MIIPMVKAGKYYINLNQVTYIKNVTPAESGEKHKVYVYFDSDTAAPFALEGRDATDFTTLLDKVAEKA